MSFSRTGDSVVATLLDTSAVALFLRRRPRYPEVARAAKREIGSGEAILSVVSATELLIGAKDQAGRERLLTLITSLTVIAVDMELGTLSGDLGAYCRRRGSPLPLPDTMIAATALRLNVPLLTTDSDFQRTHRFAHEDESGDETALQWRSLRFHPASPDVTA